MAHTVLFPPFPIPNTQINQCLRLWDLERQSPQQSIYPIPELFYTGDPSGVLTILSLPSAPLTDPGQRVRGRGGMLGWGGEQLNAASPLPVTNY